jgi:energy-coupling factor transporter ATP-binding protein EcfA2
MAQDLAGKSQLDLSIEIDLKVTIRNCNSIDEAVISLRPSALNIKYGPNGIGKSTIARALALQAGEVGDLDALIPFKHRSNPTGPRPAVEGAETIGDVLTFNDRYVSQFVFQPDEVLKNSFEIFINTDEYRAGLDQIETMFDALKKTFADEPDFNDALTSFVALRDAFNVTRASTVAKTSKGYKALSVGGKLHNIPEQLQGYERFLHSDDPAGWITWQSKGTAYLDLSENCPFCSAGNVNKGTATKLSEEFESAAVKNMSALRDVIEKLGRYFEPGYLEQLKRLTTSITELTVEEGGFLVSLRTQVEALLERLSAVRALSFHALRDEKNVAAVLSRLKIDLPLLHALNSDATASVVNLINGKLDEVATQINDIRARIGKQKSRVAALIRVNQEAINDFLGSAGYRYQVRIEPHEESYRMLLEHQVAPGHIEAASSHLSYGEKNAFALVLFMHQVQHDKPDLVVLDDPVSSFDKTKKFAILHQLFHGKNSLREVTSLLLTHDIEPAIDIVRTGTSGQFVAARPVVHFLSGKSGLVVEKPIKPADITTFAQVCDANIASSSDALIRCIYLRRKLEVLGSKGIEYQLLSSLLHLRDSPTQKLDTGEHVELREAEILSGNEALKRHIAGFDYATLLAEMKRPGALVARFAATEVGYEKVQLFRIMLALDPEGLKGDEIFTKFVNETFHIENEYVMQLNPRGFDAVPEYVVEACTKLVLEATALQAAP